MSRANLSIESHATRSNRATQQAWDESEIKVVRSNASRIEIPVATPTSEYAFNPWQHSTA